MRKYISLMVVTVSAMAISACNNQAAGPAGARDFVRVVGSSTLYPFATAVAETTARAGGKSPVVESTGTGAGMALFCAGVGAQHPDVANASRRMKASEYADCASHGVTDIVEVQVGLDGIAFAEAQNGPGISLTPVDVYKALAANPFGQPNRARNWNDVNPALPAIPIMVYGPPSTSGTRDALAELIMTKGCDSDPAMRALKESNNDEHKRICTVIREDGAYVDSGENDNLIVQKLVENPRAIGIFGFSFLEENRARLRGIAMSGIQPSYASVSDFSYPGARPLYIYVKAAHLRAINGLAAYVREWTNGFGPDGYLRSRGMVVAPDDVRAASREAVAATRLLDPTQLR